MYEITDEVVKKVRESKFEFITDREITRQTVPISKSEDKIKYLLIKYKDRDISIDINNPIDQSKTNDTGTKTTKSIEDWLEYVDSIKGHSDAKYEQEIESLVYSEVARFLSKIIDWSDGYIDTPNGMVYFHY